MAFTSVTFYIFFPVITLAYFLIPKQFRYVWLLFCSVFFYCSQGAAMPLYLLFVVGVVYISGLLLDKTSGSSAKVTLAVSIIILIGCLSIFKYAPIEQFNLFMPVGISFFTFQSLSYIIDVYRKEAKAEKNILKVALFVSFFPAILSGPIQRGKSFMPQLDCARDFDPDRAKSGLFIMLWGYFMKIVIAGRLSILTTQVLGGYMNYSGSMLAVTMIFYAFLIYCDFAGYSYIAIGAGKVMGFDLGINFRQPYLSKSVAEFWRRWHISLSGWFRDYLYIPLGGSRKGTIRKYINVMIVFIVSGIWHGNTINFLIWGFLNGFYQVAGQIVKSVVPSGIKNRIDKNNNSKNESTKNGSSKDGSTKDISTKYRNSKDILSVIGTFILLDIAWIFFAVPDLGDSLMIISRIVTQFGFADLVNGTVFSLGLGTFNLCVACGAILILIVADVICNRRNCELTEVVFSFKTLIRWLIYYALIIMILMSVNLSQTEFIYSQF